MVNTSQLLLLADHIKLSLLERRRAISLNLDAHSHDGAISRNLKSLREGVEELEAEQRQSGSTDDTTSRLRTQYRDLYAQLHGNAPTDPSSLTSPNDLSLMPDFSAAQSTRISTTRQVRGSLKRATSGSLRKNVRFSDNNNSESKYNRTDDATGVELDKGNRAALFPYRDDPESEAPVGPDQQNLNNQQIHAYHSSVLREQDTQLDTLGRSIGRQRDLSIQIGDELDGQAVLLDDVEQGVDRHQSQLDRGRKRLGNFARKAKDHMSFTVILILICILVLLIVLLK